jgi:hypothetical protein
MKRISLKIILWSFWVYFSPVNSRELLVSIEHSTTKAPELPVVNVYGFITILLLLTTLNGRKCLTTFNDFTSLK